MNADELRSRQAPFKEQYRNDPASAVITMQATGTVGPDCTCRLTVHGHQIDAGLHPAAGGSDEWACAGDMLLQSLVACAGVTMSAVATAMEIPLESASITAEGELDFCGTLGISREAPVGFRSVRVRFDVRSSAPAEKVAKLVQLTERYCVVFQTLKNPPEIITELQQS